MMMMMMMMMMIIIIIINYPTQYPGLCVCMSHTVIFLVVTPKLQWLR